MWQLAERIPPEIHRSLNEIANLLQHMTRRAAMASSLRSRKVTIDEDQGVVVHQVWVAVDVGRPHPEDAFSPSTLAANPVLCTWTG